MARFNGLSRSELISFLKGVSATGPENRSRVIAAINEVKEETEATRSRILVHLHPGLQLRIEKVEELVGYRFRDPRIAAAALAHPSSLRSTGMVSRFNNNNYIADGYISSVAALRLSGTPASIIPDGQFPAKVGPFPPKVADLIKKIATSSDFLGRVAVRLNLWENSLHRLPAGVHRKVGLFETSVDKGEFNVKPPRVLADLTGAIAGSVYNDCGDFGMFYPIWADLLFLQDNPVYVLYERYRAENPSSFPTFTRENGMFVVKDMENNGNILGSGKTIMEAADVANINVKFGAYFTGEIEAKDLELRRLKECSSLIDEKKELEDRSSHVEEKKEGNKLHDDVTKVDDKAT